MNASGNKEGQRQCLDNNGSGSNSKGPGPGSTV
jgi:hypothetical protein